MSNSEVHASLDSWTSIFLVFSGLGLLLVTALLTSPEGRRNLPIVLIILGFSLILIQYVMIWSGYQYVYPKVVFFPIVWYYLFGPLFYWYVLKMYDKKVGWIHFLPAIIVLILNVYFYFQNPQDIAEKPFFSTFNQLRNAWIPFFILMVYLMVIRNFIGSENTSESTEYQNLRRKWIRILSIGFLTFGLAYASYFVLVQFEFFNRSWDYAISIVMSLGIYTVGWMVFQKPAIFNGQMFSSLFLKPETNGSLNEETKSEFFEKVVVHMEQQKPYLNSDLRLVKLAGDLGYSSHILSEVINARAKKNFNQFVNDFRLKEAENLLLSDDNNPVKSICFQVGFNNKASFYKAFRQKHGCTPNEFKQRFSAQ